MLGKLLTGVLLIGAVATIITKTSGFLKKASPRIIATSSLVKHEQFYTQGNQTPTNPDIEARLDIHFSSRGRPAPPSYRK